MRIGWHDKTCSFLKTTVPREVSVCFKIPKGFTNEGTSEMFSIDIPSRTRTNVVKLRFKQVQLDCTKFFFTDDVVREWNKLPPSVVQCDTVNSFKNKLDHHLLDQPRYPIASKLERDAL